MLSIHDVDQVSIENCRLSNNHRVDDMLHLVYSSASIHQCEFLDARYDALDADMSQLQLTNSRFVRSGNDAVDLMGSFALLHHNELSQSKDKAVSVGERSLLYMTANQLSSNQVGVESKDDSIAVLIDNDFNGNRVAMNGFSKNWRYGNGGRLVACDNQFKNNEKLIDLDKKSRAWISPDIRHQGTIPDKVANRITPDCDLFDELDQATGKPRDDARDLDESSYLPLLRRLDQITSEPGY
jgi:hypothetical protein